MNTDIRSPDLVQQRAYELEEAGFSQAAEMLREWSATLEAIAGEIHDKRTFVDDGWGGEPCDKTVAQVVSDEIALLCRMLPRTDAADRSPKPGKLAYCRRCGRTDALKVEIHDGCYTVCCGHCANKHRGGYASTEARAIELWNNGVGWTQQ